MRNSTSKKKIAAVAAALVVVAILGGYLLAFAGTLFGLGDEGISVLGIVGIYGVLIIAVIVGVVLAMAQRLREIDSGEEEDAKKY